MKITREVITDLWPVYDAGEASADTRALVEEFLAGDPEHERTLRAAKPLGLDCPAVRPDAEASSLRRTRDLVRGHAWLRGLRLVAFVLTIFALMRIVSDTSWDVSPRPFIADATLALICWVSYCGLLYRYRSRALRLPKRA